MQTPILKSFDLKLQRLTIDLFQLRQLTNPTCVKLLSCIKIFGYFESPTLPLEYKRDYREVFAKIMGKCKNWQDFNIRSLENLTKDHHNIKSWNIFHLNTLKFLIPTGNFHRTLSVDQSRKFVQSNGSICQAEDHWDDPSFERDKGAVIPNRWDLYAFYGSLMNIFLFAVLMYVIYLHLLSLFVLFKE